LYHYSPQARLTLPRSGRHARTDAEMLPDQFFAGTARCDCAVKSQPAFANCLSVLSVLPVIRRDKHALGSSGSMSWKLVSQP
jgi:hypothetical protein